MESQLRHTQHTTLDREEHQEHGEKQSVLKKVKAKVRKIKDGIKKHGLHHGHEQHHEDNCPEFHEEDDEDEDDDDDDDDDDEDEYEEMEKDPEVHGAPIYESHVAKNPTVGLGGSQGLMHHEPNMERTDEPAVDNTRFGVPTSHGLMHHQPNLDEPALVGKDHTGFGVPTSRGLMHHQPNLDEPALVGKDHSEFGIPTSHGLMHHQPNLEKTDEAAVGKDHTRIGVLTSYGAEGVRPELEKIKEINLEEDFGAPKHTLKEGPRPGNYEADPTGSVAEETPGIGPLLYSLDKMSMDKPATGSHDQVESRDKVSTGKLAAGSRDQLERGKPRKYRDMPDDSPLITGEAVEQDLALQGGSGYGEKLAYVTAAVADKVVAAKDAAAARLGYGGEKNMGGADDQHQPDQTSYTEKASQVASLLADKAAGVKDVVASKLGYGKVEGHKAPREPVDHEALMQQNQSGYMQKVSGVTSALADKAVDAKNAVTSKLGYDQAVDGAGSARPTSADRTDESTISDKAAQAKDVVASKLGYGCEGGTPMEISAWTEKLKPGDGDKALSELISSSVYKGSPQRDEDSDKQGEVMSMSKVTESEVVLQRFRSSEEEKRVDLTHVPGSESPRMGVVDKIKVAVSSLWSSGDQILPPPHAETLPTGYQHEADQSDAGVRKLQESAN